MIDLKYLERQGRYRDCQYNIGRLAVLVDFNNNKDICPFKDALLRLSNAIESYEDEINELKRERTNDKQTKT